MLFALPLIWVFSTAPAYADSAGTRAACEGLAKKDPVATDRCLTHVKIFNTASDFITKCAEISPNFDGRFRCLKSGADLQTFHLCQSTRWSLDARLSCLRASPSADTVKNCRRLGGSEEAQLTCVRLGLD